MDFNTDFDNDYDSLTMLQDKVKGDSVKVKVDEEDCLLDALGIYKKPTFDPTSPLTIRFKGQPAVDTGGVLKQFFSCLFQQMITGVDGLEALFEGEQGHFLPIYNSSIISSNIMEYVGKMIAHGIVLANTGPQFFSRVIYNYLCSGEFDCTLVTLEDTTAKTRYYIQEVIHTFVYFKLF